MPPSAGRRAKRGAGPQGPQVAWPGDQPSTDRGEEPSGAAEDPAVDEDLIADLATLDWGPWADLGEGS